MKTKLIIIMLFATQVLMAQVQTKIIPDSLRREIIHKITEANLKFMVFKNPKYQYPDNILYDKYSYTPRYPREILGLSDKAPCEPPFDYADFMMDVKTWDGEIFYVTKKSNCFLKEMFSDRKHKDLILRDTICADLDTSIFPYNNLFVISYHADWPIYDRYLFLAGNLLTYEDDLYSAKNYPDNFPTRANQICYRLYQFTTRTPGCFGRVKTPDTCNYYIGKYKIPDMSSKWVKVKFPKRGPMDYIEIEFYTNNPKYTRQKGTWDGSLWRVKYVLRNDAKSIYDWYPKVTKLTNDEYHKVNNSPDKEFKEIILTKEMITAPHYEPEEIPKD